MQYKTFANYIKQQEDNLKKLIINALNENDLLPLTKIKTPPCECRLLINVCHPLYNESKSIDII